MSQAASSLFDPKGQHTYSTSISLELLIMLIVTQEREKHGIENSISHELRETHQFDQQTQRLIEIKAIDKRRDKMRRNAGFSNQKLL